MSHIIQQIKKKPFFIAVINIGEIYLPLSNHMNRPKEQLTALHNASDLLSQTRVPINLIYIALPETNMLVDAGAYDLPPGSSYQLPHYTPPPSLVNQLAQLGVTAAEIDHIVLTHRHWDHFNGTTIKIDGRYVPQFPNARHYLSRIDWERAASLIEDPTSVEHRTLGILYKQGLLELVDGDYDLNKQVKIIAAPGETRGHQIVRVHLDEQNQRAQTLYCLGDLYHHPAEFADPKLMVAWARPETTDNSRTAFLANALQEDALLVATHIPGIGRLQQTKPNHFQWESI